MYASVFSRILAEAVGDSQDNVESRSMLLRLDDHEVNTATRGPAGLWAEWAKQSDAVLLDISMPKMD